MNSLGPCPCFGTHADPLSQLAKIAPRPISQATARPLNAAIPSLVPESNRQIVPITATSSTHRTLPAPFKVHRLPCGRLPSSRCIRSALPKRMRIQTVRAGAPDTALRHSGTNLPSPSVLAMMRSISATTVQGDFMWPVLMLAGT